MENILKANKIKSAKDLKYIQKLNKINISNVIHPKTYKITVGIVTIKRVFGNDSLGYLTQVLGSLTRNSDQSMGVFVCNVYPGPGVHNEAKYLAKYFSTFVRFTEPSPAYVIMNSFEKEKEDYLFCMQNLLKYSSEYILILEDDAVPYENFAKALDNVLSKLEKSHPTWGILKLFYPSRWQGFSITEIRKCIELFCIGICGSIFFVVGFGLLNFLLCYRGNKKLVKNKLLVAALLGFLHAVCSVLLVGRQNVLEIMRDWNVFFAVVAPNCCSPAILYKSEIAKMLIEHLRYTECNQNYPLDKAIDDLRRINNIGTYLVEPSLVKHIGVISSLKGIKGNLEEFILQQSKLRAFYVSNFSFCLQECSRKKPTF